MEFKNIKREEVYDYIKSMEPLTVSSHHDADGVYSAVLFSKIFNIHTIDFPDQFGNYSESQISMDLGKPLDENWLGLSIDHHPHDENPKYKLVSDVVPTGLMIYNLFKEHIPEEATWLVAGSLVGDGQPSLIPAEIFESNPILLERRGSIYQSYGKLSFYQYPLYNLLASPVNATCRANKAYQAYMILKTCQTPDDVINHSVFKEDQATINAEVERIIGEFGKDKRIRSNALIINNFIVLPFSSKYRVASIIASMIKESEKDYTVICIETESKSISIRGDLCNLLQSKLTKMGWEVGGHAGYMGGSLGDRDLSEFLRDLRRI